MLQPAQVIPFLLHDEKLVRDHALHYFQGCADPAPLTADHLWAVHDRFGTDDEERLGAIAYLDDAPQTERSLRRTLDVLASGRPANLVYSMQHAIRALGYELLVEHEAEVLSCPQLALPVQHHLRLRLSMAAEPTDVLWDRLMTCGKKLGTASKGTFDPSEIDALVKTLGRRPQEIGPVALGSLAELSKAGDWRELLAIAVLGEARYEPAVAALTPLLAIDDDGLDEFTMNSLTRIGTPSVVQQLLEFIPGQEWHARLYGSGPLEQIKAPESESACLQLLENEPDGEIRGILLVNLCMLGSMAGLELARPYILDDPDHPEVLGLCEALIATAAMNGVALPEESLWRERLAERERRVASQSPLERLDTFVAESRKRWTEKGHPSPPDPPKPSLATTLFEPADREQPFRRPDEKIGRNDPCPCGSGKKYKKCCMS